MQNLTRTPSVSSSRTNVYGFLDDYSYLIQACLDLYEANFDQDLLLLGRQLQKIQDDLFWDSKKNRYLNTDGKDSSIILQLSEGESIEFQIKTVINGFIFRSR